MHPLLNDFVTALSQLTNPEHKLQSWLEDAIPDQLAHNMRDAPAIAALVRQLAAELLDPRAASGSAGTGRMRYGAVGRQFADRCAKDILAAFGGADGSKLVGMAVKDFHKLSAALRAKLSVPTAPTGAVKLDDYSPWLAAFQASDFDRALEIPGQYTGEGKPQPELHARLQNFDERVLVMSSIRRPKRLIMRGHDEREFPFLIKGGEDLRQDQRLQQLFGVMNAALAADTDCVQRHLSLRRYEVVPMTPRLGVIEWMAHTAVLKDLITGAMTAEERDKFNREGGPQNPRSRHQVWIEKFNPAARGRVAQQYEAMFTKGSRADVVREFVAKQECTRDTLLRDALAGYTASPEACVFLVVLFFGCIFSFLLTTDVTGFWRCGPILSGPWPC
jgi:DNA-dependent protein kinase catalytic subunit